MNAQVKFKYKMWTDIYIAYEWWITKHIIRWIFEQDSKKYYLVVNNWQINFREEPNCFDNLANAKVQAIEYHNNKIEQSNDFKNEILIADNIELSNESNPVL